MWFNVETEKPVFGIKVKVGRRWINAAEDGEPLFYATLAEREAKRAELRKQKLPTNPTQ